MSWEKHEILCQFEHQTNNIDFLALPKGGQSNLNNIKKVKAKYCGIFTEALILLEGVPIAGLLHGLDDRLVDAEGDGDTEQGQQQVGDDADDAEGCQWQQQQHGQAEHQARLLGVSPVYQILHCREVEGVG